MSDLKNKTRDFINDNNLVVLSTVSADGQPHASSLYVVVDDKLNLYFVTRNDTQKYRDLDNNPRVAIVSTDESSAETVQLIGEAERVANGDEVKPQLEKLWEATTNKQSWPAPIVKLNSGDLVLVKVTPKSLKYGDFKPVHLENGHANYFQQVV